MTTQILHRDSGATLFEHAGANMVDAVVAAIAVDANLEGAYLRNAYLEDACLAGANLSLANFEDANLEDANLEGACLAGASLSRANMRNAYLSRANLEGANLEGACLAGASLEGACLAGASLEGANLEGATLKSGEKLIGERPIFQVGPIGSRGDVLVAYITDQGLRLDAGCQRQITRDIFDMRLCMTHNGNKHEKEYRAALELIEAHVEIWTPT